MKKFTFINTIPEIACDTMPSFNTARPAVREAYRAIKAHVNFINRRFDNGEEVISEYQIVYVKGLDIFNKTLGFGSLKVRNVLSRSFHTADQLLEQANKDMMFNEQCKAEHERRLSLNFVLLHGEPQPDASIRFSVISMKDLAE